MAPPKAKAKAKAKVNSRKLICADVVAKAFPDFASDTDFCEDLAEKVVSASSSVCAADSEELKTALEDALLAYSTDEAAGFLEMVYQGLVDHGLVVAEQGAAAPAPSADAPPSGDVLSSKRFEAIFSKELRKRSRAAGPHGVSAGALACLHSWDGTGTAGLPCQTCSFETKDRSWTCNLGCGVQLCGSCLAAWRCSARRCT